MKLHRDDASENSAETSGPEQHEQIGRVRATLLRVWGPADSWDSPLSGTKYDPIHQAERQHESLERRRMRWDRRKQHWDERLHNLRPGGTPGGAPPEPPE
jgi:hypothetical protein